MFSVQEQYGLLFVCVCGGGVLNVKRNEIAEVLGGKRAAFTRTDLKRIVLLKLI